MHVALDLEALAGLLRGNIQLQSESGNAGVHKSTCMWWPNGVSINDVHRSRGLQGPRSQSAAAVVDGASVAVAK